MRVLITGGSGFVAPYLARELEKHGHDVVLTGFSKGAPNRCDLTSRSAVSRLIKRVRPDAVVHLAGISQTKSSKFSARDFFDANVVTTGNVCRALSDRRKPAVFLLASTGMVYGKGGKKGGTFNEKSLPQPASAYGLSKLGAEQVALRFESKYLKVYVARLFNHIGPGQTTDFVCSAFAHRIANALPGSAILVGDLSARRDFTDVRDIARAYRLILEKKPAPRVLVLGSGKAVTIQSILDQLVKISGKKIRVKKDASLSSSKEISALKSNPALAKRVLGWKAAIPLRETLKLIYAQARSGARGA